jgi:hypothetical protein
MFLSSFADCQNVFVTITLIGIFIHQGFKEINPQPAASSQLDLLFKINGWYFVGIKGYAPVPYFYAKSAFIASNPDRHIAFPIRIRVQDDVDEDLVKRKFQLYRLFFCNNYPMHHLPEKISYPFNLCKIRFDSDLLPFRSDQWLPPIPAPILPGLMRHNRRSRRLLFDYDEGHIISKLITYAETADIVINLM